MPPDALPSLLLAGNGLTATQAAQAYKSLATVILAASDAKPAKLTALYALVAPAKVPLDFFMVVIAVLVRTNRIVVAGHLVRQVPPCGVQPMPTAP